MRVKDVNRLPFINYLIHIPAEQIISQLRITYNKIKIWILNWVRKTPYVGALLNHREIREKIFSALAKDALDFELQLKAKSNPGVAGSENSSKELSQDNQHSSQYYEMLDRLKNIQLQFDLRILEPSPTSLAIAQTLPFARPATQTRNAAISVELETEIIRRCSSLFGGGLETSGFVAASNHDAISASMIAYCEKARARGVDQPEIIIFETANNDFMTAAAELTSSNIKLIILAVHPQTQLPDLTTVRQTINSNTVLMVASVPSSRTGTIDPIMELSQIAHDTGVDLHIDAVGSGLLLPWARNFDPTIPSVGFTLEGVSSIVIDAAHKGKTTEGPVVVMFRNNELIHFHTQVNQVGMLKTALAIQREGKIAEAWTNVISRENTSTLATTETILALKCQLVTAIKQIEGLTVLAAPKLGIITVQAEQSDRLNIHRVAKRMKELGWLLDYSPNMIGPKTFSLSLTAENAMDMNGEQFIRDLSSAVVFVEANPKQHFMGNVVLFSMKHVKPTVGTFMLDLAGDPVPSTQSDMASNVSGSEQAGFEQALASISTELGLDQASVKEQDSPGRVAASAA